MNNEATSPFAVRCAGADDMEEVVAMRMAFLREMQPHALDSEPVVLDLTRQYIEDKMPSGEFLAWFAEADGRVIGTGGLVFFHRPPTFSYASELHAYVLNMYTVPEWRGKGVATTLLTHMIDYIKTTPASRVSLHASELGRPIYERFGFASSHGAMTLNL